MIQILINHLGYPSAGAKFSIVQSSEKIAPMKQPIKLVSLDDGDCHQEIHVSEFAEVPGWKGRRFSVIDFSGIQQPGRYRICIGDICSEPFEIREQPRLIEGHKEP